MLKIGKNKIILERDISDIVEIPVNDLPKYLGEPLEILEGVTFETIFELILMNREIFDIVFHSFTRGFKIKSFIDDFLKDVEESKFVNEIEYLEVYRTFEHSKYDDDEDDYNTYYYDIHGISSSGTTYSISFTSLSEIKNIPIKINNLFDVVIDTGLSFDEKDFKIENKFKSIHKGEIPITLFNFIGAILHDITFYGNPENRDEFIEKLEITSEQIKNDEIQTYELKKDKNGRMYFESKIGKREYLDGKDENGNKIEDE